MRFNLLSVFLLLSVVLNGFFLGGYWFAHLKAERISQSKHRIEAIVRQLDLTQEQRVLFQRLKSRAVSTRKAYLKRMIESRSRLWKVLTSGSGDDEDVRRIIHEMAADREKYQIAIAGIVREFLSGLTVKQREKFLELSTGNKTLRVLISG